LGLFIGISLLSLVECFEIAIELGFLFYKRRINITPAPKKEQNSLGFQQ
jgi:hypothetical protein